MEDLQRWQRQFLPGDDTAVSREVLIWLLKCRKNPKALKDLYLSSRFSEPTVRKALKAFCDAGLIELDLRDDDHRSRVPRFAPKFDATIASYQKKLLALAKILRSVD